MSLTNRFNELSTNELLEYFKAASLQDHPPKELIEELAIASWYRLYSSNRFSRNDYGKGSCCHSSN